MLENMKKSWLTRSHFTHERRCSRTLKRVPTHAKRPASIRTYFLWKGDIFPIDHFTGYKKSNQNQFGRVLPFTFALKCNKIYLLFSSLSDFDSFRWRVHLSYGVCGLRARVQLKTLSSLLGRVVRKPVNANPGLKVNRGNNFSYIKVLSIAYVLCSLRLLMLKTDGQKM